MLVVGKHALIGTAPASLRYVGESAAGISAHKPLTVSEHPRQEQGDLYHRLHCVTGTLELWGKNLWVRIHPETLQELAGRVDDIIRKSVIKTRREGIPDLLLNSESVPVDCRHLFLLFDSEDLGHGDSGSVTRTIRHTWQCGGVVTEHFQLQLLAEEVSLIN
jgi:hypothetical protein